MTVPAEFLEIAARRLVADLDDLHIVDHIPLVEFNPYHDERGRFAPKRGVGSWRSPELDAALSRVEGEIRDLDGGETLVVLNPDGSEHYRTTQMGDPDGPGGMQAGVALDDATARSFAGKVVTHNHPMMGDTRLEMQAGDSFSPADIMTSAGLNVAELRMVNTTSTHVLRPGPQGWGHPDLIQSAAKRIVGDALDKGDPALFLNGHREMTKRLSTVMGWTYEVTHDRPVA